MFDELFSYRGGLCKVFFADGDGDGGGGGGDTWQSEHPFFEDNPEAAQASAKYKSIDAYHKGAYEAFTKVGRPFWLPNDYSKLTDDQKNEIRAGVAKMEGVPETADGYVINIKEGTTSPIDAQAIADLKVFAKENNMPPVLTQKLVDLQTSFIDRVNKAAEEVRESRTKENFSKLSKTLGGDTQAIVAMEHIKNYLQSKCKNEKGEADPEKWEEIKKRLFFGDRVVEEVLALALLEPARAFSEGGSPGGAGPVGNAENSLTYPEMD